MPVLCSIKERIAGHLIIEKPLIYKYFYPYIYCISIAITRMSTFNHCFSSFIIAGSGDALVPDKAIDSPNSFGDEGVPSPSYLYSCMGNSPLRAPRALNASDSISPSPGSTTTGARNSTCFLISSTQYLL